MTIRNPAAIGALLSGDVENFKVAATPGGIEAQEKAGQAMLVGSSTLPRHAGGMLAWEEVRAELEAMGVVFGDVVDDLFITATLPPGWRKVGTDHDMHSELRDDKDRVRAGIFYKAAFYDRRADISITPRYGIDTLHDAGDGKIAAAVIDRGNNAAVLFNSATQDRWPPKDQKGMSAYYAHADELRKACVDWLDEHRPQWRNATAYWDAA